MAVYAGHRSHKKYLGVSKLILVKLQHATKHVYSIPMETEPTVSLLLVLNWSYYNISCKYFIINSVTHPFKVELLVLSKIFTILENSCN